MIERYHRDALARLRTIRGHLDAIIDMAEREVYCPDIMKQVGAVQASLERVNRVLLANHLETCVTEAILCGDGVGKIAELMEALPYSSALTDFRYHADPLEVQAHAPTEEER
jgi:DNA-binding FrmR family transcriptional regulator